MPRLTAHARGRMVGLPVRVSLPIRRDLVAIPIAAAAIAVVTLVFRSAHALTSPTSAALAYLLIVLAAAAGSTRRVAIVVAVLAFFCLNHYFMPPVGTFAIADPANWVALFVFLAVSIVASHLSSSVRARAQEASMKSALLASLGHDLRTPLTAIRVAASNLQSAWLDETARREQADIVLAEVERLTRLFQNILEMARIETQAVTTEREWVTPAEIVEAAVAQVEHTLRRHQVSIDADSDRVVQVDPRLTTAALAHLLENAAQYSPEGSTVSIRAGAADQELRIDVCDEGRGIAESDLPHLFERFYRGNEARQHSFGTGMGLAITRGFVAAEGGRVWAENRPGGGARFTMALSAPAREAAVPAEGAL